VYAGEEARLALKQMDYWASHWDGDERARKKVL
jgi:hypothetical protein